MSPCFRREAGTLGKDTAGLYRIHQFDKVEQVVVCRNDVEEIQALAPGDPGQRRGRAPEARTCPTASSTSAPATWARGRSPSSTSKPGCPRARRYGETHSASRFYEFQARRLNLRYRDEDGKVKFCHTLNNTVIASPRVLIPILEIYQNADGSVTIPEVLRPYMGGRDRITG